MIANESIDALTLPELQHACNSRGIRTIGVSPARIRSELQQWLDLHLKHQVPASLLILSRAFLLMDKVPDEKTSAEALQATLSSLPDSVVNEAVLKMSELEGSATYKQRLDVIEQQEELIADELEQEAVSCDLLFNMVERLKKVKLNTNHLLPLYFELHSKKQLLKPPPRPKPPNSKQPKPPKSKANYHLPLKPSALKKRKRKIFACLKIS